MQRLFQAENVIVNRNAPFVIKNDNGNLLMITITAQHAGGAYDPRLYVRGRRKSADGYTYTPLPALIVATADNYISDLTEKSPIVSPNWSTERGLIPLENDYLVIARGGYGDNLDRSVPTPVMYYGLEGFEEIEISVYTAGYIVDVSMDVALLIS